MKRRKRSRRATAPRSTAEATIAKVVRDAAARLKRAKVVFAHGTTDPLAEAAFVVAEIVGIHPEHLAARAGMRLTRGQQKRVASLVARRIRTRKPAAYLLNRIYMRSIPFYIDERAIVPRSYIGEILDSEVFAGESFSLLPDPDEVLRVLDLCSGSGCLAILAARRFRAARVDAVELSAKAIQVAKRNIADHGMKQRIRPVLGDLFEPVKNTCYDLIVANPPYVDARGMAALPAECRHEPWLAFDGGRDGLSVITRIIDDAGRHLNKGGGLICEVGRGRDLIARAYPDKRFVWLDTEESSGEVFWLDADQL